MNREIRTKLFYLLGLFSLLICGTILFFFLGTIFWRGIPAIHLGFLLTAARDFGAAGGILYQILGTLLLIIFAALFSFPLALGTAIFKSEYLKHRHLHKILKILIFGLNGIPSIIFGVFGLIFFVNILNMGISWLVGSIILGIMILPTIVLAAYQSINSIPGVYRETARALGLTRWQTVYRVLLPQGFGGAVTGLLLGLARAAGETAPIMFIATAFSGVDVPRSFLEPVAALPTHIMALAQQATNPDALQNAWGASLVLMSIVMVLSISALIGRVKFKTVYQR